MIQQLKNESEVAISDFSMPYSIYPLCNYLKYGFSNELFKLYRTDNGVLIAQYDDSLTICSEKIEKQDCSDLKRLIVHKKIRMLSGSSEVINYFKRNFKKGVLETGSIVLLKKINICNGEGIKTATTFEEYKKIVDLVLNVNKTNVSYYNYDQYLNQIYSRFLDKYSRNLYIVEKEEFVGHIATYAESDSLAVLGGLVIKEDHRGRGLAKQLFEELLSVLSKENKDSYLFCYNKSLFDFYNRYSKSTYNCSKILY